MVVAETGLWMPDRENREKTCTRASTVHFLRSVLIAEPVELRRFLAILAMMQPDFSAAQTGWRSAQLQGICEICPQKSALLFSKLQILRENPEMRRK